MASRMAQFVAYVYPEKSGFRVFVEGFGEASVGSLNEARRAAVRIVARSVYASYPDREFGTRPGTADRVAIELRLVRVADDAARRERRMNRRG